MDTDSLAIRHGRCTAAMQGHSSGPEYPWQSRYIGVTVGIMEKNGNYYITIGYIMGLYRDYDILESYYKPVLDGLVVSCHHHVAGKLLQMPPNSDPPRAKGSPAKSWFTA